MLSQSNFVLFGTYNIICGKLKSSGVLQLPSYLFELIINV